MFCLRIWEIDGFVLGYIRILENQMETTISGLGFGFGV